MTERARILRTASDCVAWREALVSPRLTASLNDVEVRLPLLSGADNARLTARMKQLKRACGCEAGATAGALAVFAAAAAFLMPGTGPALSPASVAAAVALILTASVAARLAALLWARLQLIRLAAQLVAIAAGARTQSHGGGSYGARL